MGAVASAMSKQGYVVTGTDEKVYPPMSTFLESEGIHIFSGYKADNIPEDADLIVIGNAMSRNNAEVEAVLERKLRYMSLPETMKEHFLWGRDNYVVTGTHGKTTTTSILAWLMENNGLNPSFMIGGIARNLKRGGRFTDSRYCVLEGDEYDTAFFDKRSKFLHYLPHVLIINNIEMDHKDIYKDVEAIKKSFSHLLRLVPRNGIVFMNADCPNCQDLQKQAAEELRLVRIATVGKAEDADHRITGIESRTDGCTFTLDGESYNLPMNADCNIRNASMAICAARFAGLEPGQIRASLLLFEGVARRQEDRGTVNEVTVIDDFAHHPTAILQAISSMRQRYPKGRIWALFEPRSNTTIRNCFQHELAESLATADHVVLAPIGNFKRVPMEERLNEQQLCDDINARGTECHLGVDIDEMVAYVVERVHPGDILLTMSNGGFGGIHGKLLAALAQ